MDIWAHTPPNEGGLPQSLQDHLACVSETAAELARPLGMVHEARLAGLLHDYGKYGDLFQQRLRDPKHITGVDHWSSGAWRAAKLGALGSALAIQGHHVGLQELSKGALGALEPHAIMGRHAMGLRMSAENIDNLDAAFLADGFSVSESSERVVTRMSPQFAIETMLDVRMLYSCLTDADYLDTEAHYQQNPLTGEKSVREAALDLTPNKALVRVLDTVQQYNDAMPVGALRDVRRTVLEDCLEAAEKNSGIFTLTAPTGAGKTLAMLAFAMKHAALRQKKRVIVVLPFLSIIEQTARVYRDLFSAFGQDYVIEHHSLIGGGGGTRSDEQDPRQRARLLAENWDAPIVITSSVQFLESLFTNRPGRARKLHNVAGSVVLMDEVQTMPVSLTIPTLAALSHLSQRFSSTVVLATATQPAFGCLSDQLKSISQQIWAPSEIVKKPDALLSYVPRYHIDARHDKQAWNDVAEEIAGHHQVLAIVNLKRHAKLLASLVAERVADDSWLHLSSNMCPKHRMAVLAQARTALKNGSCRLIATQCVEAGVDIDFPTVYRAWAPLDALAQAAGRCNREATRPDGGQFVVFLPEDENYPPGIYRSAARLARSMADSGLRLDSPEIYNEYWRRLYDITRPGDSWTEILEAIQRHNFVDVAERYRLVEAPTMEILVPFDRDSFDGLAEEAVVRGLSRSWIRRARPHAVSLYRPRGDDPLWGFLEPVGNPAATADWFICRSDTLYDRKFGVVSHETERHWIA